MYFSRYTAPSPNDLLRLARCCDERGRQVVRIVHHTHSLATAPGRRFHQHREAEILGNGGGLRRIGELAAVDPGTIGTPAAAIRRRADVLSPIAAMALAGGPTNTSPAAVTASAKAARSDRNP